MKGRRKGRMEKEKEDNRKFPLYTPPTGEGGTQFALTQRSVLETGGGGIDDILLERVKKRKRDRERADLFFFLSPEVYAFLKHHGRNKNTFHICCLFISTVNLELCLVY